ncbi:MAG: hypothetical protein AAGD05_03470, partial [Bacteroidota bacterium]
IFCPECTPWLLLLLAGAWILGWLFWALFKGSAYQSKIRQLEGDLGNAQKENLNLKTEINEARYAVEKQEGEFNKLRLKLGDLNLKFKAQGEELDAAIARSKGDTSSLDQRIDELEKALAKTAAEKTEIYAKYQALLPPE